VDFGLKRGYSSGITMAVEEHAVEAMGHAAEAAAAVEHAAPHAESGIHIALAAERLGTFFGIPITNTLIMSYAVIAILVITGLILGRNVRLVPSRHQLLFEIAFEYVYDFVAKILESRDLARKYFPLLMTVFLFIFIANAIEFTPGIGSITYHNSAGETVPLLRSMNTDLNVTLALTVIVVTVIELAGVFALGLWRYAGKFINFSSPVNFLVGIIELISEIARLVSFSFRLFGNIFAGEVLIAVVTFFVPYVLPVPLMAFEMFVGFVQAAVFTMLTLFFIKIAITPPHGAEAH
jgi:F-type H+-transporting ATPase subunit a